MSFAIKSKSETDLDSLGKKLWGMRLKKICSICHLQREAT